VSAPHEFPEPVVATARRVSEVLTVLDTASAWLRSRGNHQWPEHFSADWLHDAIARGETWLVRVNDEPVATVTLSWSDPLWPDDAKAGYAHRLAVTRHGVGMGDALIDWADRVVGAHHRDRLRLDCVARNNSLRRYYEQRGFAHRGDAQVKGAPGQRSSSGNITSVSRYERLIAASAGNTRPSHPPGR
jgi:Acetyltransferase (GNAT) family